MDLNEYQDKALSTAMFSEGATLIAERSNPDQLGALLDVFYCSLKLNGEAGEFAELVAKAIRDYDGDYVFAPERLELMAGELGDVLWYVAVLADQMGMSLDELAQHNVNKLQSRKERGVLGGSGSNR
jgi:Predicted pyrophosphatase